MHCIRGRALDGFVELRQRAVFWSVGDIAGKFLVLGIGIRVGGREQARNAFAIHAEGKLPVRSVRAIGRDGHVGSVPTSPLFLRIVPPDNGAILVEGLSLGVAGGTVVENVHIAGPRPGKARIDAKSAGIGFVVAALGKVLAAFEKSGIDPGTAGSATVGLEVGDPVHRLAALEIDSTDLAQHCL